MPGCEPCSPPGRTPAGGPVLSGCGVIGAATTALFGESKSAPAVRPAPRRNRRLDSTNLSMEFSLAVLLAMSRVQRPRSPAHENQKDERTEHGKIGTRIADHVPEALVGPE